MMESVRIWTRTLGVLVGLAAVVLVVMLVYRGFSSQRLPASALHPVAPHSGERGWCDDSTFGVQSHLEPPFPQTLAAWCLLRPALLGLELSGGVLPYDLNTHQFVEYAHSFRTVWLPPRQHATYHSSHTFAFPVGTILSRTLYYPLEEDGTPARIARAQVSHLEGERGGWLPPFVGQLVVQTQLLVHSAQGWVALPYIWNAAQTQATLTLNGAEIPVGVSTPDREMHGFDALVPNVNECRSCHLEQQADSPGRSVQVRGSSLPGASLLPQGSSLTGDALPSPSSSLEPGALSAGLAPLGLKAHLLNRDFEYADGKQNQLERWVRAGALRGVPARAARPRAPEWDKPDSGSLEDRALSYLEVQCAHCHRPEGLASSTGLFLTSALEPPPYNAGSRGLDPVRLAGRCKPPLVYDGRQGGLRYDLVPGAAEESILLERLRTGASADRMPESSSGPVHAEGVALVRDWIDSLEGGCPEP